MRLRTFAPLLLAAALTTHSLPAVSSPLLLKPPTASELALTPEQATEWAAIQADAIAFRQSLLDELSAGLPVLADDLAATDADLPAIVQQLQSQALYALWRSQPIRQRRMDFYLSLTPAQQQQVRQWLIEVVHGLERVVAAADALSQR
ncbi:MAG: Spy/CpxP family protein refolding chaperone [Xanthomonadales bacterium]|nr:Spy/CpxP family protein refolding chaperone [Xanthomonadales bacterium]MCB1627873.1 Spy/CpxP family protein refolding chaperone [Xanthomonadales bacterium]MCB1633542.1 Spy/CpxP family protein refolding chaperone [Xanthomonadales bacterium]MCB1640258.1 Spy/CpxP family protein refolding chaperone [Xanthomonadales bacterium]